MGNKKIRRGSPGKSGGAGLGPTDLLWALGTFGSGGCCGPGAFEFPGEDFTVCGDGGCNGRKNACGADVPAGGVDAAGMLGEGATGGGEATELGFGLALAATGLGFGQDDVASFGLTFGIALRSGGGEAGRDVGTTEVA